MTLEVRAAEVFVAVADELHFGRAAARLHMTQPAISRHVRKLELGLGVTLFKRSNRHVELTPEGTAFLAAAREVLAAARRAVEAAQLAGRGAVGTIRFGSAGTFPNELAVRLIHAFRREHSAVEVSVFQSSYVTTPTAGIDRDQVDVGLVRAPLIASGVEFEPVVREPRVLAVSANHRLAGRWSVTLEEIAGEPIVSSLHWSQRVRDYWAGAQDGLDPAYQASVLANGPGEWLAAVADGRGVCLCPGSLAGYYTREDLAYVRVEGLAPNAVGLAWRPAQLGPVVENFIDQARAFFSTMPVASLSSVDNAAASESVITTAA
jgi:DNA-binding transcriptional LysR family regulator